MLIEVIDVGVGMTQGKCFDYLPFADVHEIYGFGYLGANQSQAIV